MSKQFFLVLLVLTFTLTMVSTTWAQHEYVGVKSCKMCHRGEQNGLIYETWEASKHAKATEALAAKGEEKNADCLKCHSTGFGKGGYDPAAEDLEKFAGVQCEACHGPGKDYKTLSVMKDREAAIANGLIIPNEETCKTCHNTSNHKDLVFDFSKAYPIIEHKLPEKAAEEQTGE